MQTTTELNPHLSPDLPLGEEYREGTRRSLGRVAFNSMLLSAGHFYGGEPSMVKTLNEYVMLVHPPADSDKKPVMAGTGHDYETAIHAAWEGMRNLETIHTAPIAHIEMTRSGNFVDFTKLEHYAPKIAPGSEVYPIPDYLSDVVESSGEANWTYHKTIEEEGWQEGLYSLVETYIANDPDGIKLAEDLGIRSLNHLTPEQAVKLSSVFVQNVSKFERLDSGRADSSTTLELLQEGIDNKNNPKWLGNGVCRNVASNIKAVFEALKYTQSVQSMLRNTYCVYDEGFFGEGYEDQRPSHGPRPPIEVRMGHAWNKFVTIDKNGSAVVAIIDATNALGTDLESAIEHLDYTEFRTTKQIIDLAEKSDSKVEVLRGMGEYIHGLDSSPSFRSRVEKHARPGIRQYITTAYLKVAGSVMNSQETLPDIIVPDMIKKGTHEIGGRLNPEEIESFFALNKSSGIEAIESIKRTIFIYDRDRYKDRKGSFLRGEPDMMIFHDDELQALAYNAVGNERVREMANKSIKFRSRLNDLRRKGVV